MVRKVGDGFEVLSEAGKHMGKYPTREEADKRLREIEYFKHQNCSEAFMNGTAHGLEYLANAGFDESKHPRDRGGKFGTGMSEAETRKEERKITAYLELKHALKRKSESKKSMSTPDFEKHVAHHESIHGDKSVKYKADHKKGGGTWTLHKPDGSKEKWTHNPETGQVENCGNSDSFANGEGRGNEYLRALGLKICEELEQ